MNRDSFWLTKDRFARLRPLLPSDTRGKPRVDDRRGYTHRICPAQETLQQVRHVGREGRLDRHLRYSGRPEARQRKS
jgi:hypothetical protein